MVIKHNRHYGAIWRLDIRFSQLHSLLYYLNQRGLDKEL